MLCTDEHINNIDASYTCSASLISRSQGACDDLCEVHMYVQRTEACVMATVELRWMEERIDNLLALLNERPCLYDMKLRD